MVKLGTAICAWGSKKQATVAISTCESEYYTITLCTKETVCIRRVLKESNLEINGATTVWSDIQSAINWATGERCPSGRAKHINVQFHLIRDLITFSVIHLECVPSDENDADLLTKPLSPSALNGIIARIGLGEVIEE